jgi:hypothetical protein
LRTADDTLCPGYPDEYCDINLGCLPVGTCSIQSVEWGEHLVSEGTEVDIIINTRFCSGDERINVDIYELDFFSPDDWIAGGESSVGGLPPWPAEFRKDEYGVPEYYIVVELVEGGVPVSSGTGANEVLKVTPAQRQLKDVTISLYKGKNQFTMPLIPADNNMSVSKVFSSIEDSADRIYTYQDGEWKIYHFNKSGSLSNLDYLREGQGYIVFMNEDATFTITGSKSYDDLTFPRFTLMPGWTLMSTFYEEYNTTYVTGGANDEVYQFNPGTGEFEIVEGSLYEDQSYWVYLEAQKELTNPETGLPTRGFWGGLIDFIFGR